MHQNLSSFLNDTRIGHDPHDQTAWPFRFRQVARKAMNQLRKHTLNRCVNLQSIETINLHGYMIHAARAAASDLVHGLNLTTNIRIRRTTQGCVLNVVLDLLGQRSSAACQTASSSWTVQAFYMSKYCRCLHTDCSLHRGGVVDEKHRQVLSLIWWTCLLGEETLRVCILPQEACVFICLSVCLSDELLCRKEKNCCRLL